MSSNVKCFGNFLELFTTFYNFVQPKRRLKSLWTNHVFFVMCKLIITMPFKNVSSVSCDIYRCSKNCSQCIIICNRISICKISIVCIALTPAVQCNYLNTICFIENKLWDHPFKVIMGDQVPFDSSRTKYVWQKITKIESHQLRNVMIW